MSLPKAESDDEISCGSGLSIRTRVSAFIFCTVAGLALSFLAFSMMSVNPRYFTLLYILANVAFLSGTAFIMGPGRQARLMFSPERLLSTLIYLAATIAVFLTTFNRKTGLASILLVVQVGSLCWYALSYIPFAQRLVSSLFGI